MHLYFKATLKVKIYIDKETAVLKHVCDCNNL